MHCVKNRKGKMNVDLILASRVVSKKTDIQENSLSHSILIDNLFIISDLLQQDLLSLEAKGTLREIRVKNVLWETYGYRFD